MPSAHWNGEIIAQHDAMSKHETVLSVSSTHHHHHHHHYQVTLSKFDKLHKKYDKRDDFDFDIVNFPFLDDDVPRRTS